MAEVEAENASWARTAKDLFAGAAGGVAQVLLGKLHISKDACCTSGKMRVTVPAFTSNCPSAKQFNILELRLLRP